MALASVKKKISILYDSLRPYSTVTFVGGVGPLQSVLRDDNSVVTYSPDYSLTNLVIIPQCYASAPGETAVSVNSKLSNILWQLVEDGVESVITNSDDFTIMTSGNEAGKLTMKRNCQMGKSLTLNFSATYADTTRGEEYYYKESILVQCISETAANPKLTIDVPVAVPWNPLRDTRSGRRTQVVTAKLDRGGIDLTSKPGTKFFWYRVDKTNAASVVERPIVSGSTEPRDLDIVSVSGNVLTIDLDRVCSSIGSVKYDETTYICKAGYNTDGTTPSAPSANIATKCFTVKRSIPALECDYCNVADVPDDATEIKPKAVVQDSAGVIPDASVNRNLICTWGTRTFDSSSKDYTYRATGINPKIPKDKATQHIQLEINDKKSARYLTNSAGKVITTASRAVIITSI